MDTSIIVVIAIVVVFAVAVPAMIRKSATELSRVEIDTVPDEATVISAEAQNPCRNEGQRTAVFQPGGAKTPTVPRPDIARQSQAPALRLSAPAPEFAVIDGLAEDSVATNPEADDTLQSSTLPAAVGETRPLLGTAIHQATAGSSSSGSAGNVRMLHPAVQAVFNQGPSGTGAPGHTAPGHAASARTTPASAGGSNVREASGARRAPRSAEATSTSRGQASAWQGDEGPGGGASELNERGPRNSNPKVTADEEHSMTEKAAQLRESMSSLGAMIRGFALLFLGSALGILVTGVLAMFSVVHVALVGVFLGLAVVSLVIVRTLNMRKREVKARLRKAERTSSSGEKAHRTPAPTPVREATPQRSAATSRPEAQRPTSQRATTQRATTTQRQVAQRQTAQRPTANADAPGKKDAGTTATTKVGSAATTKAAQARAAMQHSATAKLAREEADTGEIPLVRVRSEAAEGHTTRQVLLTGPIPIVEEKAAETDATPGTASGTAPETAPPADGAAEAANTQGDVTSQGTANTEADADTSSAHAQAFAARTASLGADLAPEATTDTATTDTASASEDEVHAALDAASPRVDDPFMQRLKSRDGWSPTPLPVPSYVEAAQVEHPVPEATTADASSYEARSYDSYEMQARSREDIAAQFAAELGYRPELSDSAREEGPLEHGRTATRTRKSADLGAVNDVLARRRA